MDEKQYWLDVSKAKEDIFKKMEMYGISKTMEPHDVVPMNCQIEPNGGMGLEFYYDLPYRLYTPLGYVTISTQFIGDEKKNELREQLVDDYGLEVVIPETKDPSGRFGPVYAITKLPWSDEKLPLYVPKNKDNYVSYEDAMVKFAELYPSLDEPNNSIKM